MMQMLPKYGSKRKIPKTTIGEILERARAAAAVADPRRSIPCRLGLPRRPLSAGEDDISFAFISVEGALKRPITCDGKDKKVPKERQKDKTTMNRTQKTSRQPPVNF